MKPLYRFSLSTAKSNDEITAWRDSLNENIRCRDYLDNEVRECFDGFRLPDECAENCIKEFGYDRTFWVIANTIRNREGDGRFRRENVDWAKNFNVPDSGRNYEFALKSHSCIVDGLASDVRKMYASLGLFSREHIVQTDEPQDYTNKLLILRDTSLKEEYRTPENQLFLAKAGLGVRRIRSAKKYSDNFFRTVKKRIFTARIFSVK